MHISLLNLLVIFAYFTGMVALGFYFSRRQNSQDNYFLGGRGFPGWALGISMISALISSVTFIAGPADTFKTAWLRVVPQLILPLAALVIAFYIMPFFRKRGIVSAYGYLNSRFGRSISVYAALVFLLGQLVRTSTILYLLAILMQSITGFGFGTCLLVMGLVTAIYAAKGGFNAVVWTDVVQTAILVLGAIICVAVIISSLPRGLSEIVSVAVRDHKLSFWDAAPGSTELIPTRWSFSLSEKSIIALITTGFFGVILSHLDQGNVQRWSAAKSDEAARRSILVLGFGALPIWVAFKFVGTGLYAYYERFPSSIATSILEGTAKAEEILPHFIMTALPNGIAGIVISGALAAGMSTVAACINASSMVWVRDLYSPLVATGRDDQHYLRVGKLAAWIIAAAMIGGAWLVGLSSAATLADLVLMIGGILIGTVPGVFLLGIFTKRANLRGTCVGLVAACVFLGWCSLGEMDFIPESGRLPFHIYYSGPLGNLVTIVVGYCASLVKTTRSRSNIEIKESDSVAVPGNMLPPVPTPSGSDQVNS
ncbi:sodium:solute symporter family transporter [Geminisphaera colitermitum]|uniref:sodium:solute symporter family transporter n=1 Tax=Geminisphaera colitermitum TaxID=1148786 RepID=UPI000158D4E8|nr:sodium/solute symporter [Geminisphaera colitermitum]